MDEMTLMLIGGATLAGAVGAAIGQSKGKTSYGLLLGLLLGPLGWLLVAASPSGHPKCPACKGDVVTGATKCKNCGSDLG
jgi:hypothetical protein